MKKNYFIPTLLTMAALVTACSSMPKTTSLLDQARSDYVAAQNDPKVASYAQMEMKQATEALNQANAAAGHDDSSERIDRLAYVAKQKIALAEEVGKQKSAEMEVANAGKERDQIRLDQRTNEANQANMNAQAAQVAAAAAQQKAQIAQNDTIEAQRQTAEAQAHAAQLEKELNDLSAKKTERGMVITFGDVLFGTDQSKLTPNGMRVAQKLADVLQQNPQRSVLIEGFTDSTGSNAHNLELSERRASAVRSALQLAGIARDRIDIKGYGEAYPVADNAIPADRQLNRRVEIVLSNDNGKVPQRN